MERQIVLNQIMTPDGTGLMSVHRHDYKDHHDRNGKYYAIDGGQDYLKRISKDRDYTELTIYSDDPFIIVRECLHWGVLKWSSDGQYHAWSLLKDLDSNHIRNIIVTQKHISRMYMNFFIKELIYRGEFKTIEKDCIYEDCYYYDYECKFNCRYIHRRNFYKDVNKCRSVI